MRSYQQPTNNTNPLLPSISPHHNMPNPPQIKSNNKDPLEAVESQGQEPTKIAAKMQIHTAQDCYREEYTAKELTTLREASESQNS